MAKSYFFKEIASNPVIVNGAPVQFQHIAGNRGLLELESGKDDELIAGLTKLANDQVGGIVKLNEAQFAEKKTQAVSTILPKPKEMLRVLKPTLNPFPQEVRNTEGNVAPPADGSQIAPPPAPGIPLTATAPATSPTPPTPVIPLTPNGEPVGQFQPGTRKITRSGERELAGTTSGGTEVNQ